MLFRSTTVDDPVIRCICKIAFNYMTYIHKAPMSLRSDFDDLRRYIRYGESPAWLKVRLSKAQFYSTIDHANDKQTAIS